jgi:23S rRNA (guanine2445-N2)-methyltransferase / 23S rRNA (guanine2069-N7)-methyltransferase
MNPPYGERLGEDSDLQKLYEQIGEKLKNDFLEWRAAIFTGNPELGKKMGLRARKHYALFNGAIPCQLLLFDVTPDWFVDRSVESANERRIRRAQNALNESDLHAVQMFVNRLQKNSKHIRRWAERENISCYRLYDADLPEYAVAIDKYEDFIIVKEYPAPKSIDKTKAERRLQQILAVLPQAMEISEKNIYLITRDRMERDKYSRFDLDKCQIVNESQVKYLINLRQENNDVGLSLQQRLYRSFVRTLTHDKHVLNLFSRSGATAVAAALGGAKSIMNVDESEFSLEWTKQNLLLNEVLNKKYEFIRANPVDWIETAKLRFDCIITELPESSHRVREEYHEFIKHIFRLLQPNGIMLLTSRDARFKFNFDGIDAISIEDLTKRLISADFSHNARANPCVLVRRIG